MWWLGLPLKKGEGLNAAAEQPTGDYVRTMKIPWMTENKLTRPCPPPRHPWPPDGLRPPAHRRWRASK